MASDRQERGFDAHGQVVTGLPASVNASDAVRRDEMLAGDAAVASGASGALATEIAARIAGDINAISVSESFATAADTTILATAEAFATAGDVTTLATAEAFANSLLVNCDGISTGTVQLTTLAFPATGLVIAKVASVRDCFYLDRTSTLTADGITIVTALGGTGRWIRMGLADPSWAATTAWFIDPAGGSDENTGATGSRLKTRSELARRIRGNRLTAPVSVTVAASLNAGDTQEPQVQTDLTNFISWVGAPIPLFTGTISAITNRNGSTGQPTLMQINSIGTSWTLGNGTTSFLNMLVEWTDGSGHFISARVVKDQGSKTASLSAPIAETNLETTFTNGTTVTVYDLPSLGPNVTYSTTKQQFTYLKVDQRWLMSSGQQIFLFKCWGDAFFTGGTADLINHVDGGLFSGANLQNLGARLNLTGGYHRLINTGGTCSIKQTATFSSIQIESSQLYDFTGGVFGVPDIEISASSTTVSPLLFPFGASSFVLRGFLYGTSARSGSILIEMQDRQATVSLGHVPNVTGANLISYVVASTSDNVSVLATRESSDVNGNRVIGPAGPTLNDNHSQPITNVADPTNPQDVATKHYVDAGATASVSKVGHAAESVLVSIAGTVSDLIVAPSRIVGRGAAGDVDALTAAAVKTLLTIVFADVTGTLQAAQFPALTGDVTTPGGSFATTLANLPQSVLLARTGALSAALPMNAQKITGVADPSNPQDAATKHYVDASFSGGVPLTDGDKGDVVVSGSGAVWTVDADAVSFAKMQNIPTQTLIGRQTAATGDPESIGVTGGVEFDGSGNIRRSALTGDVVASAGSAGTVISNNAVTNGQLAQVPTGTVKGRTAAGTGNTSDLTFAALKTAIAISLTVDVIGILQAAQFPALTGDVTSTAGSLVTTLANIPNAVPMAGSLLTAGIAAPGTPAAGKASVYVDSTNKVWSSKNDAGVVSHTVRSKAALASQFLTSIGDDGTPGSAQPGFSDLTGSLLSSQSPALTGDVTKPAGSGTTTLANIPNDTPTAGDLLGTAIAAPAAPAAGKVRLYPDSASLTWAAKNNAGVVTHMVKTFAAVASEWITSIDDDGTVHASEPNFADLGGVLGAPQFPALHGDVDTGGGGTFSTLFSTVAAKTIIANTSAFSGRPSAQDVPTIRTMLGLDAAQSFDLVLSYGIGDGNNNDSLTPSSMALGNLPFFLLPTTRNSDVPVNGYFGGNHDADLIAPAVVNDWLVTGAFSNAILKVNLRAIFGLGGGSSIVFILSKNGLLDASPCSVTITTVGADSGVVALGGFAFGASDRVGVRCQVLGGAAGVQMKAHVTVHLTP